MFEYLRAKNHQPHRDLFLELDKGVNVIQGLSTTGKTSILREIILISENRPSGAKYYSNFAPDEGQTIIELKPSEGNSIKIVKTIVRKADKKKSLKDTTYWVGDIDFPAPDKGVPDQVKKALNLSELNIQKQFDRPFLIMSSSGEFARTINRLTKIDKADDWVAEFKRRAKKVDNETDVLNSQIENDEKELAKYTGFEDLATEIKTLKSVSAALEQDETKLSRLNNLLDRYENCEDQIEKLKAFDAQGAITTLERLENEMLTDSRRLELLKKAESILRKLNDLSLLYQKLKDLERILIEEEKLNRLNSALDRYEKLENSIENLNTAYNKSKEDYLGLLENTKECPLFKLPCPAVKEMTSKVKEGLK